MSVRYLAAVFLLVAGALAVVTSDGSPRASGHCAPLDVRWSVERDDYTYRLRGRYAIAGLDGELAASISSDDDPDATGAHLCIPTGLYRVTLEPGYVLERFTVQAGDASRGPVGDSVEVVPASLVSPNPMVITAGTGRIAPLGLSLVDMPGTAPEPEATCMNGS